MIYEEHTQTICYYFKISFFIILMNLKRKDKIVKKILQYFRQL